MGKYIKEKSRILWYSKGKLEKDKENEFDFEIYDDFITDDRFRNFLISRNAYENYIKFSNKKFIENFNSTKPNKWIDYAFTWSSTGNSDFWSQLNEEWTDICEREYI